MEGKISYKIQFKTGAQPQDPKAVLAEIILMLKKNGYTMREDYEKKCQETGCDPIWARDCGDFCIKNVVSPTSFIERNAGCVASLGYRVEWPTAEQDMIKLSQAYPNVLFQLSMRGIINTIHFMPTKRWYYAGYSRDVELMLPMDKSRGFCTITPRLPSQVRTHE